MRFVRPWTACIGAFILALWLRVDVHRNVFLPHHIDLLTVETQDLANGLHNGSITSVQLVQEYLRRIALDNQQGLQLRAVLTLSPHGQLIATAESLDRERLEGFVRSPLHGMPVFVKGNMATDAQGGMATTFGAYAFQNATAPDDAFIVKKMKDAGLIILGKTNLAEMGGFKHQGLSPGWSALGGETISPYDNEQPCGSSSGSAVAVTAGFAPLALGTETSGSLSCPASFTSLYTLRPSTGYLSRSGILPASSTFDTPGVLARNPWEIATLMTIMAGLDHADPATDDFSQFDHHFNLSASWKDFRIGFADRSWYWEPLDSEHPEAEEKMISLVSDTVAKMRALGADVIDNVPFSSAAESRSQSLEIYWDIIRYEMNQSLPEFFGTMAGTPVKNLAELVAFNKAHENLAFAKGFDGQGFLEEALASNLTEIQYHNLIAKTYDMAVTRGIENALEKNQLDFLLTPAWSYMSIYSAWAKSPAGTVPLGMHPNGKPFGLGFVGRRFEDKKMLQVMSLYQKTFHSRLIPERMRWKRYDQLLPARYRGYF